jgi:hypothetical protein
MSASEEQNEFPSYNELYDFCMKEYAQYSIDLQISSEAADRSARSILKLQLPIKEAFLHWWKTGEVIDDIKVDDYTLGDLFRKGYPPFTCFINFNAIYKNPNNYFTLRLFWDSPPKDSSFLK